MSARCAEAPRANSPTSPANANAAHVNMTSAPGSEAESVKRSNATSTTPGESGGRTEQAKRPAGADLPPGQEGADPREQDQEDRERSHVAVEPGRGEGGALARDRLGDEREEGAPEDDHRKADEQDVVDEEDRLARGHRLDAALRPEIGQARDDQAQWNPRGRSRSGRGAACPPSTRRTRGSTGGSPSGRGTCRAGRARTSRRSATRSRPSACRGAPGP